PRRERRRRTLGGLLLALTIGTLLPVLLFAAVVSWLSASRERGVFEAGARARTRTIVTAVEAEIRGSTTTLDAIATSKALETGDLVAFRAEALRALKSQPEWISVNLADAASGQQLVNTHRPAGATLPKVVEWFSFGEAGRGNGMAGGLTKSGVVNEFNVPIRVPVRVGGQVRYVLTAAVSPRAFQVLLQKQGIPDNWIGGILDRDFHFIARTADSRKMLGAQAGGPEFLAAARASNDGVYHGRNLGGQEVYTPFVRSRAYGWIVAIGIPAATVEEAPRRAAATIAVGTLVALALAFVFAEVLARRIAGPIGDLAGAARGLAGGEALVVPQLPEVREFIDLGRAFRQAGEALSARDEARAELLQAQTRARRDAEEANQAKDEFLAMLGHELRNPLSAISNASSLLTAAGAGAPRVHSAAQVIGRQVTHMTHLVDDLLDVARVTTGKIALAMAPVDLAEVVDGAVETLAGAGRTAERRLDLQLEHAWVEGDRTRLEQVVINLVGNALRYTMPGGAIAVTLAIEGGNAVLTVVDDGIGIAPAALPRVFDLFFQAERSIDRKQGGLGIGLTLVRRLIELHGGGVTARSAGPGRGSTFTVTLPCLPPPAPASAADARAGAELGSRRILLVEDNTDARESLAELLRGCGHEVAEAEDGPRGLAAAREGSHNVALIDIGLPGLSGYEVAAGLRADPATSGMRLIALTGYGQPEDAQRALAAGFDLHLTKPVDLARLLAALAPA
ncbi:MAG TPA: ATP-binding protein, partial [Burkholderiales bacterium]